jgi:hypothetical protein
MKAASVSPSVSFPLWWALILVAMARLTNSLSLETHRVEGRLQVHMQREALASRRDFILLSSSSAVAVAVALPSQAQARNIDTGPGGVDLYLDSKYSKSYPEDVLYPKSMQGPWLVERTVTSMEGDAFQAETAWRSLGGSGDFRKKETYLTRYLPEGLVDIDNVDPNAERFTILDRGFERQTRSSGSISSSQNIESSSVVWTPKNPDTLQTDKVEIAVVQRKAENPTDEGWGYDELYRVTEGTLFQRAARVKRRYRRAFDETGNRIIEGLEIQKTFRVLDGIAGTEFPTSTTKSMIRMKRPDRPVQQIELDPITY